MSIFRLICVDAAFEKGRMRGAVDKGAGSVDGELVWVGV